MKVAHKGPTRVGALLSVALCATSCLPPTCAHRVFGPPNSSPNAGHFATLTLYSGPVEGSLGRPPPGDPLGERLERAAFITIDGRGSMAVSKSDLWPRSCPTISRQELAAVSRHWQPVLERIVTPHTDEQVMANATTGRPDGPLLSLQFGPQSGKNLGVLWDGESLLSQELETAVMATLEMMCSNSRLAKRYLLHDLPRQLADRLECREKEGLAP